MKAEISAFIGGTGFLILEGGGKMNRLLRVFSASVLTAVLLLSGCSSAGTGTSTSGSAAASAAATTAGEAVASPINGVLAGYSGEILSVKATDGKTYEFVVPDPSVFTTTDALNIGDDVQVTFTGTVNGTDTTQATVTKVEDKSASSQTVQTIVGTVTDATMNTMTIQATAGLITFDTGSAQIISPNGVLIGDTVYIDYIGTINGTDASKVVVTTVVDNDDNRQPVQTAVPTPTPVVTATPSPEPTLVPQADIPVTVTNEWLYALQDATIYRGNSIKYKKVGTLWKGQGITVIGRTDDGWSKVNQEGVIGFVVSTALTSNPPSTPTPAPTPTPTATPAPTATPVVYHNLIINYKDTDGNTMFKSYVANLAEGTAYSVSSPLNMGSTPSQATVAGTMGNQDITVNVIYTPFYYSSGSGNGTGSIGDGASVGIGSGASVGN